MKKLFYFLIGGIILFALIGGNIFFFIEKEQAEKQRIQEAALSQQWQGEFERMKAAKEAAEKEKEQLRGDVLSYLDVTDKFKKENVRIKEGFAGVERLRDIIESQIQKIENLEIEVFNQKQLRQQQEEVNRQEKEEFAAKIVEMEERETILENTLIKESAASYYNMAVVYSQTEVYQKAISSYKKSLELQPNNPDACYNLGLLYEEVTRDFSAAGTYYFKYLQLKPDADDYKEVQKRLKKLAAEQLPYLQ